MSELLLYPVLTFSLIVSFAFQHLVPAILVRMVVSPCFSRRLMPKSANLAFPFMSVTNGKSTLLQNSRGKICDDIFNYIDVANQVKLLPIRTFWGLMSR